MQAPDYGVIIQTSPVKEVRESGIIYTEKVKGIIGTVVSVGKNVEFVQLGMTVQCFKGHRAIGDNLYSAVVNPDKMLIHYAEEGVGTSD